MNASRPKRLAALLRGLVPILALALHGAAACAADLTIGRAAEQSSLDPLFARSGNNDSTSEAMFERLLDPDADLQLRPALAVSWRAVTPTTWEIRLRDGVKFHDGSAFSAEDVIFSLERARSVPNSPAPFSGAVGAVAEMKALDRLTLRIVTKTPTPTLMQQLERVFIMSRKAAGLTTADLNGGKGLIGTGPYRFVEYVPSQRLRLQRFDGYWGTKPEFDNVTLRFIPKDAARVAALLAGDVDLIDQVSPNNVAQIKASGRAQLHSIASARLVYLALDASREQSPFLTDAAGKKLDANPLRDLRVRQAISRMIDRKAIVERLLEGSGEPAGQMVPAGLGGHDPGLAPDTVDVQAARTRLAEAGWPNGFGITVHSSNDRFPKDADLVQALGQMLTRGGLKVNGVQALPYNVYAQAATRREYSAFVFTYGTSSPDAGPGLTQVLATQDKDAGMGAFNRTRYANPQFDAALKRALAEFDEKKRYEALREATRIAFADVAIVPLYWQVVHWAARKGIAYEPQRGEQTAPQHARIVR